jgi:uncharacterized membrane protein
MDKPLHHLDHHFNLPRLRSIEATQPLRWLKMGWSDMRDNLTASLSYGVLFALIGYVILRYAVDLPYLFTAAISGFFLVGPLAAAGLYEISRRHELGTPTSFMQSLRGLRGHGDSLFYFGLLLAITLIAWERISAILFGLFYHNGAADLDQFFPAVFMSGDYLHFIVAYFFVGGILAAAVYCLSAISIPMLMDRESDVATAMMTSTRAVGHNLGAMALWAVLIVALTLVGFATMMIGMVVILPLLGHASWHAYRDLVE